MHCCLSPEGTDLKHIARDRIRGFRDGVLCEGRCDAGVRTANMIARVCTGRARPRPTVMTKLHRTPDTTSNWIAPNPARKARHASRRLLPLWRGIVQRRQPNALPVQLLLLLSLPEDDRWRWLRHQSHGRRVDPACRGQPESGHLPSDHRRRNEYGHASFLPVLRQSPVVVGPALAGTGSSTRIGDRYRTTGSARARSSHAWDRNRAGALYRTLRHKSTSSTAIRKSPSRIGTARETCSGSDRQGQSASTDRAKRRRP